MVARGHPGIPATGVLTASGAAARNPASPPRSFLGPKDSDIGTLANRARDGLGRPLPQVHGGVQVPCFPIGLRKEGLKRVRFLLRGSRSLQGIQIIPNPSVTCLGITPVIHLAKIP